MIVFEAVFTFNNVYPRSIHGVAYLFLVVVSLSSPCSLFYQHHFM